MELGSEEHKNLLLRSIYRTAMRIVLTGFAIGIFLMLPILLRENTFSTGLFFMGVAIMLGTLIYAAILSRKKYTRLIKPFNNQAPKE